MKILVAISIEGRFQKVGIYNIRNNGAMSLPAKFNGQLEGKLIRSGAKTILSDPAINWVDCQYGSSPIYRICRM